MPASREDRGNAVPPASETGMALAARLRWAAISAMALAAFGLLARETLARRGLDRPLVGHWNAFEVQYCRFEAPFLLLLALVGAAALASTFPRRTERPQSPPGRLLRIGGKAGIAAAAAGVLLVSAWGTRWVFQRYPFAMDEFAIVFQSRIFARGFLVARLPELWRPFAEALRPIFIQYSPVSHSWAGPYLPVYAALRTALSVLRVEVWTNPLLGGLAVLLVSAVAERLWPGDRQRRIATVFLLVTSGQFLLMSMTVAYSMPAHLCMNLLWLWCFLAPGRARVFAPAVGVLAMGLHNPLPHLLFAAPFFGRMFRERKLRRLAVFCVAYLAGALLWWAWLWSANPWIQGHVVGLFGLNRDSGLLQGMHATLVLTWQSSALALLLLCAVISFRKLRPTERDLLLGVAATFVFYGFFPAGQVHGWGYRFVHGVLGNIALLGATMWPELSSLANAWSRRVLLLAAVLGVVSAPVRMIQVRNAVAPFVAGATFLRSLPAEAIAIDTRRGWFLQDYVRNDPFLESSPKILFAERLGRSERARLLQLFGSRFREVSPAEFVRFGMPLPAAEPR